MRTGMFAFVAGLLLLRFLPALPPAWLLWLMPVVGLMLLPFRTYPLALFLFGVSWACLSAQSALDDRLAPALDGRTLWLQGTVVGLPDVRDGLVRFQLEGATSRRADLPGLMRLSWYGGPSLLAGETWRLAVRLKRPHGLVNPQAFDYEAWLLARRLGATGTVKSGERVLEARGGGAWRDALRQRVLETPAHGREGAIAALVLGDGSGLSVADWRVLQDTGTVHLLVISGQHISLVAGLLYGLIAGLARLGWWPRALPWLPWACALAFAGALGYGFLAGFEVPVRRACVMVGMVLLWRWRFQRLGVWLPFMLAMAAVLVLEPLASLQPGFWLSFGSVALLVLIFGGRLGVWPWWVSLFRAQWAMTIGLLPFMLALGLPVSMSGPLANLIAVPWVGILVVPIALLGVMLLPVPWLGAGLLWIAGLLLEWLFLLLAAIATWLAAWLPAALPVWAWLSIALGAFLLLLPAGIPLRGLGWVFLLPLLYLPPQRPPVGQVEVTMLDVGQGLAVVLRTHRHALLYDAGARFGDFDTGERIVLPSMRAMGVSALDLMLISHADNDHAGGAEAIRRGMPVKEVWSGEAEALPRGLDAQGCRSGQQWWWDDVRFSTWQWAAARDGNQASCVLLVEANGERLLLTGDIDRHAERALLASGLPVRADWLLAPHHGSRTSSSAEFLHAVSPRAALISRSRHNAFGHPDPQVVARYEAISARLYDTAVLGAVQVNLGAHEDGRWFREQRRFWREK
ncbi:MAG: DNA internalization-related competence protein ComEC/Rec2 [Pseudomonas sp.]|uniref:DNA internalization-related competence protein ComEC/Rec2 n=1 Tax=Pseudomonas sp. TaxID=306 RepID=UPI003D1500ED